MVDKIYLPNGTPPPRQPAVSDPPTMHEIERTRYRVTIFDDVTPTVYGLAAWSKDVGAWTIVFDLAQAPIQSTSPAFLKTMAAAMGWIEYEADESDAIADGGVRDIGEHRDARTQG